MILRSRAARPPRGAGAGRTRNPGFDTTLHTFRQGTGRKIQLSPQG
ncbi:hypothetical protein [Streptomyces sp. A1-5]|nr:hypothetical protein [Streptomyces sp. A1-5]UJB45680.1 hypothetical protein HRD51_37270 [Streptomyces sp. A1-5]